MRGGNCRTCPLERRAAVIAGRIRTAESQMRSFEEYLYQLKRARDRVLDEITAKGGPNDL
jgi:hypothetical protein